MFADISQVDGLGMIRHLFTQGLGDKLLFGSHTPFFNPQAALAKVILDLNEKQAERILFENARKYVISTDGEV